MIKFNYEHAGIKADEVLTYQDKVKTINEMIDQKSGKGNDFLGWVDWPMNYDIEDFERIKLLAKIIRNKCNVLVVCGIGGSYLGARAAIEMIQGLYANDSMEIIYFGNTFSSTYIAQVLDYIKDKEVCVNVISKSGTTTETAMAFRLLKEFMYDKYKEDAFKRIVATTDKEHGMLKELADKEGYESFVIPDDIGGRFSVITSVGLFPIAVMGIDIDKIMDGLKAAYHDLKNPDLKNNSAYEYAVCRRIMEKHNKDVEMFVSYEPHLATLGEWWKQLFGESEGKDGKGNLPSSVTFSTDLHSLGQFIQDGKKIVYETILEVEKPMRDLTFPHEEVDNDGMNYLAGKSIDWINKMAMKGTLQAHVESGKVPNLILSIPDTSAYTFGYLCYFYFKACAMTCYLLDINPFDQPGVEIYKKNMFALLGKK